MAASAFLPALPGDLVGSIALEGFVLQPRTKPVLAPDGRVHVRLVWRRRETGSCVVVQWTLRGAIGDDLLDALDAAIQSSVVGRQSSDVVCLG
jgi:hypothetical protein